VARLPLAQADVDGDATKPAIRDTWRRQSTSCGRGRVACSTGSATRENGVEDACGYARSLACSSRSRTRGLPASSHCP